MKYVVVAGSMGVGKSYLIDRHVEANVPHNEGRTHVTRSSEIYKSRADPDVWFVDTVGLDKDGIPHNILKGKKLCYVVILSSLRVDDEMRRFTEMLGPSSPIYYYWTSRHPHNQPHDLTSADDFNLSQLQRFEVVIEDELRSQPPRLPRPATGHRPQTSVPPQLKKHVHLPQVLKGRIVAAYDECPLEKVNQEKMMESDLKALTSRADIEKFRRRGEKVLEYVILCMGYENHDVQSFMSNERLAGKVHEWGLNDHIDSLYPGENDFCDETLADYIEALFGYVYAKDKRKIVDLLVNIVS